MAATIERIASIAAKVPGSAELTPNSKLRSAPARNSDATIPIPTPMAPSRNVCSSTLYCTPLAVAPSAMRMPISWVRKLTE